MKHIGVILADNHAIVRQGLRALIDQEKDMHVLAEASDGLLLLDLVRKHRPKVVLVDLKMPNMNGISAAEQIHHLYPDTQVVILSMHADRSYIENALQVGALGYVLKEEDFSEIAAAIHHAAAQRHYLSREILRRNPDIDPSEQVKPALGQPVDLTMRERQILQMAAEGRTSMETGKLLGISGRTVEVHRDHIRKKFGLKTRADFLRLALEHGSLEKGEEKRGG